MKTEIRIIAILFWVVLVNATHANSQNLVNSASRTTIEIGEQFEFKIQISNLDTDQFRLEKWPSFSDTTNHFVIADIKTTDSTVRSGKLSFTQVLSLTSFDPGRWNTYPVFATIRNKQNDSIIIISTNPLDIIVKPADLNGVKTYFEPKDIIHDSKESVKSKTKIIYIGIALMILIVAILMIRQKNKKKGLVTEVPMVIPLDWAKVQLRLLRESQRNQDGFTKENYQTLYQIFRKYFSIRTNKNIEHITTEEWKLLMQSLNMENETKETLLAILTNTDHNRFSKEASKNEMKKILDLADEILQKMDDQLRIHGKINL